MSERSLWLLTGALVLLLAIWGAVTLASSLGGGSPAGAGELARALEGLDQERVGRVVLAGPTDTVALERADGSWTANGFETDSAAVARLWTALSEVEVGDLAAANPANHARLGVTADSAWSLGFHSGEGEELARILLGNRGPGMASAYARLPDDDEVFLLEGGLRGAAARETDHWRDKVIVQVDTSRVQRIDVSREGEAYALTRGDDGWTVDGQETDPPTVRSLLGGLARFEAQGFAPDTATFQEGEGARRVVALGSGSDTLAVLELSPGSAAPFLARTPARPYLYQVPSWRVNPVTPALEDVRAQAGDGSGGG